MFSSAEGGEGAEKGLVNAKAFLRPFRTFKLWNIHVSSSQLPAFAGMKEMISRNDSTNESKSFDTNANVVPRQRELGVLFFLFCFFFLSFFEKFIHF